MLYHGSNPILKIAGVEHIRWKSGYFVVPPRSFSALAFRISGKAVIEQGAKTYRIGTGELLYLPQNMAYTADYTDTEMIAVHFYTEKSDRSIERYPIASAEELYPLFRELHALWTDKEPGYMVYAMAKLYQILGTVLESETKTRLPAHLLQAVSILHRDFRNPALSIPAICRDVGISQTQFRQLFKKHYRKTPVDYITHLRLENARSLISGGTPIELAATESGFNDPKYFARVVKKTFGCTPRSFKTFAR